MSRNEARRLMLDYAARTGLEEPSSAPTRYLWTDAFAVCNFLGLHLEEAREGGRAEDAERLLGLALRLVDQVHQVLGRHRPDDERSGWLSGLPEAEGEAHPTRGGLRIGKPLPERGPDEPFDPGREWDRDGQYFHYLTRWMHALDRVARVTGERRYHEQACELARAACRGFLQRDPSGRRQLVWKMSVALDRPLVPAAGAHDPLDGLVTCCALQASSGGEPELDLGPEIRELARLCTGLRLDTDDPLGLGGLMCDALRVGQLAHRGALEDPELLAALLGACERGLDVLAARDALAGSAEERLAFRELGLSIGLHALDRLRALPLARTGPDVAKRLDALAAHASLAARIEQFWLEPAHRAGRLWREHRDIDEVMLATSLAPAGYLGEGPVGSAA